MEAAAAASYYYYYLLPLAFIFIFYLISGRRRGGLKLPPSPPGALPILGHIRLLKPPTHRVYQALAQKLGPIFSLRLGNQLAVVISSGALAEECFTKNNDIVFANRPHFIMGKHMEYDNTSITQTPYGDNWRNLRRICTVEILSTYRINATVHIRTEEIRRFVAKISGSGRVELKTPLNQLAFDIMTRMVSGKRYYGRSLADVAGENDGDEAASREFTEIMKKVAGFGGANNREDFVPLYKWLDGGKFEKEAMELAGKTDRFFQSLIDEHRIKKDSTNTMIDHLLTLHESDPEYYTDQVMKGLVLVMVVGGTETNAVTIEWAMSCLLNHPDVLAKAKDEIDKVIGQDRIIEDSDLSNLPYLQNVLSETLRLYPAAPFLVPHMSSADCVVGGYEVPRGTILLVNAYVINRDPKLWDDPLKFKPERHAHENNGGTGKEGVGKYMTFGMGRRACPGAGLALKIVGLSLGTLIQCFDWERVSEEMVDMAEARGITMPKLNPLEAICTPRPIVNKLFS